MKKCPNGHEVSGDVKFCPQCGAEMLEDVAEDVRFCKKCGNERKGVEKFCSHCGHPFYGNIEAMVGNQDSQEEIQTSSLKKWLVSLLIIIPLLLIGGYFVNNHIQEKKRIEKEQIEKKQIEEKERAAAEEAERKRIEEENKPSNLFFNLISQNSNKWMTKPAIDRGNVLSRVWCLYFYPISKTSGYVSVVNFSPDFSAYSRAYSCKVPYTIQDDYIVFTARYTPDMAAYEFDEFMLQIQRAGNNIRLVRTKNGRTQVFDVSYHGIKDPVKQ